MLIWRSSFEIVGQAKDPANKPEARISAVSGDYAQTMGTPVLRGRMIGDGDTATTPFVAVVNQAFARKYFAGQGSSAEADRSRAARIRG